MYAVYVLPQVLQEVKNLPGNVRQRVKRTIDGLAEDPRPSASIALADIPTLSPSVTLHRLRIEKWRIYLRH
jgi:mRNA-degrading endonuclease RelE of RelBE toxin-antitoxin system